MPLKWVGPHLTDESGQVHGTAEPILRPTAFGDWRWAKDTCSGRFKSEIECKQHVEELCNTNIKS